MNQNNNDRKGLGLVQHEAQDAAAEWAKGRRRGSGDRQWRRLHAAFAFAFAFAFALGPPAT